MSKFLAIWLFLLLVKICIQVNSQSIEEYERESAEPKQELVLDFESNATMAWELSTRDYEDWFYYYDSLNNLSDHATTYFQDVDLTSLTFASGVWVAFNSSIGPPIWDIPYPIIKPRQLNKVFEKIEITYCIYQHACIRIYQNDELFIQLHSENPSNPLTWTTYVTDLLSSNVRLELVTFSGDFVLIDKIVLIPSEVATRPSVTPNTPTTEIICANSNDEITTTQPTTPEEMTTLSTTTPFTTTEPIQTLTLDLENDTTTSWNVSATDNEEWFFYYNSLDTDDLTEFAQNYFQNLSLTSLKKEEGVWIAFNSPEGSLILNETHPIIKNGSISKSYDILEISYYVHGNATINLYFGDKETPSMTLRASSNFPIKWETFAMPLLRGNEFKIELVADQSPGDFVIIDKVILTALPIQETTTGVPSTVSSSTLCPTSTATTTFTTTTPTTPALSTTTTTTTVTNESNSTTPYTSPTPTTPTTTSTTPTTTSTNSQGTSVTTTDCTDVSNATDAESHATTTRTRTTTASNMAECLTFKTSFEKIIIVLFIVVVNLFN